MSSAVPVEALLFFLATMLVARSVLRIHGPTTLVTAMTLSSDVPAVTFLKCFAVAALFSEHAVVTFLEAVPVLIRGDNNDDNAGVANVSLAAVVAGTTAGSLLTMTGAHWTVLAQCFAYDRTGWFEYSSTMFFPATVFGAFAVLAVLSWGTAVGTSVCTNGSSTEYNSLPVESGEQDDARAHDDDCLLYTSPSPRDQRGSRMPSSA